jgi:catechol 2,3-dioxygenase-like lactoylglutathione lyase family enzyme
MHFFFDVGNGRDAIAFFWFEDAPESAPGITQSGRWIDGAPRRSAIGAMDHVALDVPREKIEEYHDSLRAKGVEVTEIVNHSDQPGKDQYLPDEPTADTFVRSIYFQDPDGITLEFACWGRPLTPEDVLHTAKTAADLNPEKRAETVRRAQAAVETIGANQPST